MAETMTEIAFIIPTTEMVETMTTAMVETTTTAMVWYEDGHQQHGTRGLRIVLADTVQHDYAHNLVRVAMCSRTSGRSYADCARAAR